MKHPLDDLISAKIKAAEANGDFEGLAGAGKPLENFDDPQNAYFNRIMRENKALPEFVLLSQEAEKLRASLSSVSGEEKAALLRRIAELQTRIALAKDSWNR